MKGYKLMMNCISLKTINCDVTFIRKAKYFMKNSNKSTSKFLIWKIDRTRKKFLILHFPKTKSQPIGIFFFRVSLKKQKTNFISLKNIYIKSSNNFLTLIFFI